MMLAPALFVWLLAAPAGATDDGSPRATTSANTAPVILVARKRVPKAPAPEPLSDSLKASYQAMPVAERAALQFDLIWTGDYNGIANGEIGASTTAAVKTFQKRNAMPETGFFTPVQRAGLAVSAERRRDAVGWRVVNDSVTGAKLGLPAKLAPQIAAFGTGSRWSSVHGETTVETFRVKRDGATLATVFAEMRQGGGIQRQISYSVLRDTFFVISGLQGLKKFYTRAEVKDGEVRGVTFAYDQAIEGTMDKVAVAMSSAFTPFSGDVAVLGGPVPQRKVLYGTGLVVSRAGDILTDAHLTRACRFVTVGSLGPATVVATDETAGLSLLHVFAPAPLKPLRPAPTAPFGAVILAGIADPQSQEGGDAATTILANVVTQDGNAALQGMPDSGFSGAAVLRQSGAQSGMFSGVVQIPPQTTAQNGTAAPAAAKVIPASVIATFLTAHGVDAKNAPPPVKVTDGVVRVICVRPEPEKK